jgi:hypothetical protein
MGGEYFPHIAGQVAICLELSASNAELLPHWLGQGPSSALQTAQSLLLGMTSGQQLS